MNFIEAVKLLDQGKVVRREGWNGRFDSEFKRLIKNEYGILKTLSFTYDQDYEPLDEDILADDWVEAEKESYVLKEVTIENGMQFFMLKMPHNLDDEWDEAEPYDRFEFKSMLNYLHIKIKPEHQPIVDSLMNPTIQPFTYEFKVCAVCDSDLHFEDSNKGICPNGCVVYDVDPQGEDVTIFMFESEEDKDVFMVNLYPGSHNEDDRDMKVDLQKFQEVVAYWRENERYKERITQS